jgi:hypothetical protein
MGPLTLAIELDAENNLVGSLMGSRFVLLPHREATFKVKDQPTGLVEFVMEAGRAVKVVVDDSAMFERVEQ